MNSLEIKLEKNIEIFSEHVYLFKHKEVVEINTKATYNKFINWVSGEFDLFIKNESEFLKVYFPNGWFSIKNFKGENNQEVIEIKVEGKSEKACKEVVKQLNSVFNHVLRFSQLYEIKA
ncbi:hypothetical protein FPF71_15175 [Algibacter amylolyticus]|uniref:Uncharacterized protein n=1 Tax=Algibacter amylolyticus TaxID=1608400 RepID=A0A5M7B0X8_9FLAO|nr:hypothetical protein [Algibacter amylolyticus]KAA5821847.1 hypothetical protein F2B50_15175 [Algibacter amylolyticus]MBB5269356.1 hypothetical protein [Algibacter amylolyticus]TSJ73131.1 hypothetical protein FPF71_15175 [Algibacter amylolyticus]